MINGITRRNAIVVASMSLAPLSGCTFIRDDTYTVTIHLINNTPSEQEFYTELTYDDDKHQFGRVRSIPARSAIEINTSVPQRTYIMKTNVDDIVPRPEKTTKVKVAQNECEDTIYCTLETSGGNYNLRYSRPECSGES
ncbi:hypothetical protein [Halorubellus sp. PRR65]|uniref:hypothetical protein n=1 Tax=Halorubellus sp. PRR65 TaxID=3098148 RepID=UPI002B26421F|nr:hypothetical protein [Halorubellus sp. PRR65]